MEKRLGRGLGSLLGSNPTAATKPDQATGKQQSAPGSLPVASIRPNPFQPRKRMDPVGLEELRDSIREHGILQAVVVRPAPAGEGYELVSGERRWRASQMVGLKEIPASVRDVVTDAEMLELALVENVQRRELDAMERAKAFKGLMDALGLTQQGVADKVGLQRATVANHLRLLDLPSKVQEAVVRGLITMGHARALLGLSDETAMLDLLSQTVRNDHSVRVLEDLVRQRSPRKKLTETPQSSASGSRGSASKPQPWVVELQRRMQDHLGARVQLQDSDGTKGRVVIDYASRGELDRLCELLAPRKQI